MNNKLKLLLALLAVSSVMGVAAACDKAADPEDPSTSVSQPADTEPEDSTPEEAEKYTVKFVDYDDTVLSEEEYEEGATVTVPKDPTRAESAGYSYTFTGWDQEVKEVTGDVTYKATYSKTAIEYTITFVDEDGETAAESITYTVETLEDLVFPEAPSSDQGEGYTMAWDKTVADVGLGGCQVTLVRTAIPYSVTFVDEKGNTVADPITYTIETMSSIEFPAITESLQKAGYTAAWNKAESDVELGGCEVTLVYTAIQYTVTFTYRNAIVAAPITYTVETIDEIEFPAVPEEAKQDGFTAAWDKTEEDVAIGGCVVTLVYTPIEYSVTFVNEDGDTVADPIKYTILTMSTITFPAITESLQKAGYTAAWNKAESDVELGGCEVTLVYTAIQYTVTFTYRNAIVAAPITYTIETIDEIEFPNVPDSEKQEGYTVAWDKTEEDVTIGGCSVQLKYTPIVYTITFMNGEEEVDKVEFSIEDKEKTAPAVPEKTGYTGTWDAYSFESLTDQTVYVNYEANTYTITYDANGGTASTTTQDVQYDDTYSLATATAPKSYQEFLGWVDANGNEVVAGEKWNIAENITLTAVYSKGVAFETLTAVPSAFSGSRCDLSIAELNGKKVMQATATADADIGIHVTLDMMNKLFADSSVQYVAFDLKLGDDVASTYTQNNSEVSLTEAIYYQDYTSGSSAWTRYETRNTCGYVEAPTVAFKSYYLSRSVYQSWVDNSVSAPRFIMIGKNVTSGKSFYIDNIRPVTAAEHTTDFYSFEYGDWRSNGNTPLYYTYENNTWELSFSNVVEGSQTFTNDIVSDGNRAIMFTKLAGKETQIGFNGNGDTPLELAWKAAGYVAFDLYVPAGADASMTHKDHSDYVGTPLKEGWNTVYVRLQNATTGTVVRFTDTTGSTYVVDNFRTITEDEYYAKAYDFETGTSMIRDLEKDGGAKFVYSGYDVDQTIYTMAMTGGTISDIHFDRETVHDGEVSLAITKTDGSLNMQMRANSFAYENLKNGFTCWIYSTVELSGSDILNGNGNAFNGGAGVTVAANTWTQITFTTEDIVQGTGEDPCLFLKLAGAAGTIYLDGIEPIVAD